jgi:hypothetical protein
LDKPNKSKLALCLGELTPYTPRMMERLCPKRKTKKHSPQRSQRTQRKNKNSNGEEERRKRDEEGNGKRQ